MYLRVSEAHSLENGVNLQPLYMNNDKLSILLKTTEREGMRKENVNCVKGKIRKGKVINYGGKL